MTIDYAGLSETAQSLITNAGILVEIKRESNGSVDDITQAHTPGLKRSFSAYAAILPTGQGKVKGFDNKSLAMTSKYQRFVILSAIAEKGKVFEPEEMDQAVFEGYEWNVAGCTPVAPSGIAIVYRLGCFR